MAYAFAPIQITAAVTLDRDTHANGPLLIFNVAAGATVTLPASAGNGDLYRFYVHTTVTSNSDKIQVANATDVMTGMILTCQDAADTVVAWEAASTSDTITLNGTTTGGLRGDYIEIEDAISGFWRVRGNTAATGTEATPFSAAVS
jgi:hypothetical protein